MAEQAMSTVTLLRHKLLDARTVKEQKARSAPAIGSWRASPSNTH
jgi:hypothetical protein